MWTILQCIRWERVFCSFLPGPRTSPYSSSSWQLPQSVLPLPVSLNVPVSPVMKFDTFALGLCFQNPSTCMYMHSCNQGSKQTTKFILYLRLGFHSSVHWVLVLGWSMSPTLLSCSCLSGWPFLSFLLSTTAMSHFVKWLQLHGYAVSCRMLFNPLPTNDAYMCHELP